MGLDALILVFWVLNFKLTFSLSSFTFIKRLFSSDAEAETPILWPPDAKNWLIGKVPDAVKDWRREEKGTAEDDIVGWHHQLDGHEFEHAPGVGDGQADLACCSPRGHRELDATERLTRCSPWGHRELDATERLTRCSPWDHRELDATERLTRCSPRGHRELDATERLTRCSPWDHRELDATERLN